MLRKKIKVKALEGTPFFISEGEPMGAGSFGAVFRAYNKDDPSKELVAKVISLDPSNLDSIKAELKVLKQIPSHPNLVNCLKMQISSGNNFYLIMEYCNGGTFEKYIEQNNYCSEQLIWRFLRDFCAGYQVLYDCHVIHRDIKPQNILLHNGKFKIADFGLSRKIDHHSIEQNISIKGTPLYLAPQIQSESHGCSKADMFSLGTVLYRLAYNGAFPFFDQTLTFNTVGDYFRHLQKAQLKFPKFPKRSKQLEELIEKMLSKDPTYRLDWKILFEHQKINNKTQESSPNNDSEEPSSFSFLRKSIVEIGKSSAKVQLISQPFNHQENIAIESKRIMQFTQFATNFQIDSLEVYAMRKKILIELIRHLNGLLKNYVEFPKHSQKLVKHVKLQFREIFQEGLLYCHNSLKEMKKIINSYSNEIPIEKSAPLLQKLSIQEELFQKNLQEAKSITTFQYLKFQNTIYDFLIQYIDRPLPFKEALKVPTALMVDIYDGLLKLESMTRINDQGRVEMIEIDLQDAELDKIDYRDLRSYEVYLRKLNEVTVPLVEQNLTKMGLIIM